MDPSTRRRHLLVIACVLALAIMAVLSFAHPSTTEPVGEDTAERITPPGESVDEPLVGQPRANGLSEPDEVYEDVEGPSAPDDKE